MSGPANRSIEVQLRNTENIVMPSSKDPNSQTIKFGIITPLRAGDTSGELVELEPNQPLSDAVAQACQKWGFLDPSIFALKFGEKPSYYVTGNILFEM